MEQRPEDRGEFGADAIRLAYAEWLQQTFEEFRHENMSVALEAGARAMIYLVQAGAYDRLDSFASGVVSGVGDPRLLDRLIPYLETAASSAPEGRARWSCLAYLADGLSGSGRPDKSLSFYEDAAGMARAAAEAGGDGAREAWADFAWIADYWSIALVKTGSLAAARDRRLASAELKRKAGRPEAEIVGSELEALRIDIRRGEAEAALPQANETLAKLQSWWERARRGETLPKAADMEVLARSLIGALDLVREAHMALKQWELALGCLDDTLRLKLELRRSPADIALTRFNRAFPLIRLKQFPEAKQILDACLEIFQSDPAKRSWALSTLADLYKELGDNQEAITQERRALALRDTLPDPQSRAISHHNIANYLESSGDAASIAEANRHRLASLGYGIVADLREDLKTDFSNYIVLFRRARAAGAPPAIPLLADLLADPAFDALAQWLRERQVDLDELQAEIDQFLADAREAAEQLDQEPPSP